MSLDSLRMNLIEEINHLQVINDGFHDIREQLDEGDVSCIEYSVSLVENLIHTSFCLKRIIESFNSESDIVHTSFEYEMKHKKD